MESTKTSTSRAKKEEQREHVHARALEHEAREQNIQRVRRWDPAGKGVLDGSRMRLRCWRELPGAPWRSRTSRRPCSHSKRTRPESVARAAESEGAGGGLRSRQLRTPSRKAPDSGARKVGLRSQKAPDSEAKKVGLR